MSKRNDGLIQYSINRSKTGFNPHSVPSMLQPDFFIQEEKDTKLVQAQTLYPFVVLIFLIMWISRYIVNEGLPTFG